MDKIIYASAYFVIMNIASFIVFYVDKKKAIDDKWRIEEKTLHALSFLGGAIGSFIAMKMFHHKTKKPVFVVITIIALAFNFYLFYLLYKYVYLTI